MRFIIIIIITIIVITNKMIKDGLIHVKSATNSSYINIIHNEDEGKVGTRYKKENKK